MEGKRGNYIALAVTLSALGALLLCSQAALESARAGLNLCAQMIVPSLLPFFILSALPEAVRSAVRAVLTVSGFVVTFSVMTGVLDASGLLPALVGTSAARLGLELHFTRALCTGVLELGTGIGAMQGLMPTPGNLALAAFLIGWGGVSVHCQTAAVIAGTDIKSARHTVGRLLHGAISALCMWVLASLALFS